MSSPGGFALVEAVEDESAPVTVVTLRLSGQPVVMGRLLDLIEHAARLGNLACEVEAPGFHQAFYGWEPVQDDG